MKRSLLPAASGMMSQQTSVDTIANNLANVNTIGYKQEQTQLSLCFIRIFRQRLLQLTEMINLLEHR